MPRENSGSSSYRPTTTPFSTLICGLPLSTLIATGLSAALYITCIVILLCIECPKDRVVIYYFCFLLLAIIAQAVMAGINMVYVRYRFNCLSLSASLFYSGSAALIAYGLVSAAENGLCALSPDKRTNIFSQGLVGNYIIWFITLLGLLFQVVAHYYYG